MPVNNHAKKTTRLKTALNTLFSRLFLFAPLVHILLSVRPAHVK